MPWREEPKKKELWYKRSWLYIVFSVLRISYSAFSKYLIMSNTIITTICKIQVLRILTNNNSNVSCVLYNIENISTMQTATLDVNFVEENHHQHEVGSKWSPAFEDGPGPDNVTARFGSTVQLDCKIRLLYDKTVCKLYDILYYCNSLLNTPQGCPDFDIQ